MKKILALAVLIFFSGKSFAAVYSVENISEKVKGDRLSLSDVNSILGTIRGFFFDDSTGFVGIGTESPSARLEIQTGSNEGIRMSRNDETNDANFYAISFYDKDETARNANIGWNEGVLRLEGAETISMNAGGVETMVIHPDGNVGIGSNNPTAKLYIMDKNGTAGVATTKAELRERSALTIFPDVDTGTTNLSFGLVGGGDTIGLQTTNSDSTADWNIALSPFGGNVGIGTGDPTVKLEIAGSDWDGIKLTNDGNIGTLKYDPVGTYVEDKQFLILSDETTNADGSNAGIMFRTNNGDAAGNVASRMVIRETGNVGIGTSEPNERLEVAQNGDTKIKVVDMDQNGTAGILLLENQSTPKYGTELLYDGDNNIFHINNYDGSETPRTDFTIVRETGKIGIGTDAPAAQLAIGPKSGAENDELSLSDESGYWGLNAGTNFMISDDGTERVRIDSNGRVGIGTITPAADLDINDISEGFPSIMSRGKSDDELDFAVATNENIQLGTHDRTANGGTTLFIIYPNGNATLSGILTENSDSRLKKNIQTLSSPLEKITALRGVEFEWKDRENQSTQIGLVAQEVAKIFPELVQIDENGTHSVAYSHLVAPLIEAVKTQQTEIQTLRERVQKLENKEEN